MKFIPATGLAAVILFGACQSASSEGSGDESNNRPALNVNVVNTPDVHVANENVPVTVENDETSPVTVKPVGTFARTPFRSIGYCELLVREETCIGTLLLDGVNGTLVTEGIVVIEQVGVRAPHSVESARSEPVDFWLAVNYNDGLGSQPQRLDMPEPAGRWYISSQQVRMYHDVASAEPIQFGWVRYSSGEDVAKVNISISGYVVPVGNVGLGQ